MEKALELITIAEAAQRLGISNKSVYHALAHGRLTKHERYNVPLLDAAEVAAYRPRPRHARHQEPSTPFLVSDTRDGSQNTLVQGSPQWSALLRSMAKAQDTALSLTIEQTSREVLYGDYLR